MLLIAVTFQYPEGGMWPPWLWQAVGDLTLIAGAITGALALWHYGPGLLIKYGPNWMTKLGLRWEAKREDAKDKTDE